MILVDTGPLVALFDPKDVAHTRARTVLERLREPMTTTVPVLTDAFHLLGPASVGSARLRDFVAAGGASVFYLDPSALQRSFELMERYADHPMDLADASLVVAAEQLRTQRCLTLDRTDFAAYRVRRGHRMYPFVMVSV